MLGRGNRISSRENQHQKNPRWHSTERETNFSTARQQHTYQHHGWSPRRAAAEEGKDGCIKWVSFGGRRQCSKWRRKFKFWVLILILFYVKTFSLLISDEWRKFVTRKIFDDPKMILRVVLEANDSRIVIKCYAINRKIEFEFSKNILRISQKRICWTKHKQRRVSSRSKNSSEREFTRKHFQILRIPWQKFYFHLRNPHKNFRNFLQFYSAWAWLR